MFSALVLGAAALGAGCTEPAASREPAQSAVAIPLTQQLGGKIYHLTANFEITGPDGTVQRVDGTGNDPSVTVQVTPGINAIQLLDGWTLSRSTDGGATFAPVSAVLGTMNPVNLIVDPSRVSTWQFDFIVRDATTQLSITFGVVEQPRQISTLLFINGGFGEFAKYSGTEITLATYFTAFPFPSTEADGTQDLQYFASISALEFFGDKQGLIAPLGEQFAGGFLNFTIRNHPDGTQDFSGQDQAFGSKFVELQFGTGTAFLTTDPNGAPVDTSFFAFGSPFVISQGGSVILTGQTESIDAFFPGNGMMMPPPGM